VFGGLYIWLNGSETCQPVSNFFITGFSCPSEACVDGLPFAFGLALAVLIVWLIVVGIVACHREWLKAKRRAMM